ncbi:MAG: DUF1365 domain-containing protein [Acidobacteriota bacterium]|nr:DUF1365 domain-containing protein [Acidobacteriota bacterium]
MSASCIYEGVIRHRRIEPRRELSHGLALAFLDLDELPGLLGGLLVRERPGPVRFRRRDYLGDARRPLDGEVRDRVQEATGRRPDGPIRLLTQLRSFGHCFNPVSFYYCMDQHAVGLEALVAEVTNTPWGERHSYVIGPEGRPDDGPDDGAPRGPARVLSGQSAKALHVSPFMGMDHVYSTRASTPGGTLSVHIESRRSGTLAFEATLSLARRELTRSSLARVTARYPVATVRVLGLIYAHAAGMWLSRVPVHPHPARSDPEARRGSQTRGPTEVHGPTEMRGGSDMRGEAARR